MKSISKVFGLLGLIGLGLSSAFSAQATAADLTTTAQPNVTAGQMDVISPTGHKGGQQVVVRMVCLDTSIPDEF